MRLSQAPAQPPTAVLALADGLVLTGFGLGAPGEAVGEVCFNTAMTGYEEILTDPSYAGQIITFTFPHIGNVGVNAEDIENASPAAATAARGAVFRAPVTSPSNYRAQLDLSTWMKRRGIVGLCGVDTRMLTARIREKGMPHAVIAHNPAGEFDIEALRKRAADWAGLEGRDLAREVTTLQSYASEETMWRWGKGYGRATGKGPHVVVIDYGVKRNILRLLAENGARVTVMPATASFEDIIAKKPDGVVLSNGPGDPAATGEYAIPVIRKLIEQKIPTFGVCLGHQMLALAAGAKTRKMAQGHHGANHPVKDLESGKVEIVSMNHGFTVDQNSLPANIEPTFVSLFDGTNSGIRFKDAPAFSVQHHPEASPGPQDSFGLFKKFVDSLEPAA
ncbi:MAG: glutamine-hydrolyzing carbamoyl-phosphate synthase small subunit [Alphaproteobacteria bacterium]|nr:glutamine-hydrolyzing carbamoyl-phosphate synthase small subunit [Alphaproteobacteria bacterium]